MRGSKSHPPLATSGFPCPGPPVLGFLCSSGIFHSSILEDDFPPVQQLHLALTCLTARFLQTKQTTASNGTSVLDEHPLHQSLKLVTQTSTYDCKAESSETRPFRGMAPKQTKAIRDAQTACMVRSICTSLPVPRPAAQPVLGEPADFSSTGVRRR